ncbi:hypothetical protein LQ938_01740 [Microbacterium sp. cx-55]|uniref:hypothetical protein n=1 Tax=Microbacterium sp. cx-55 TaxID=2875948 RepID=UPI001CBC66F0|nr:hypothetical protein [Microbacterium sp. cx-55]MBZ4487527.1 hypothetical protein [Microbacterium sp. cx-55]UGB35547.1 hypothetical protein LQ938_01740 [Microbacterium sp. cx-55]
MTVLRGGAMGVDDRRARTSSVSSLAAAGLFVFSGALQFVASWERWVTARAGRPPGDVTLEDHLYDYFWPADPWVNVGAAAQLLGLGMVVLAVGVIVLAVSVRAGTVRAGTLWTTVAVVAVAVPTALTGIHALVSGGIGAPSALQHGPFLTITTLLPFAGLIVLSIRWMRRSPAAALACLPLLATTMPGYLFALFAAAPLIVGYQSHDTTPWSETIIAVCTGLAALPLVAGAGARRWRTDAADSAPNGG